MWQAAKILPSFKPPQLAGRLLWTIGKPSSHTGNAYTMSGNRHAQLNNWPSIETNLFDNDIFPVEIRLEKIELLPIFVEKVEKMLLKDFLDGNEVVPFPIIP